VRKCTYPLTGLACVSRVYTDLAVFLIDPHDVVVRDVFGITFDRLTALVDPPLIDGTISWPRDRRARPVAVALSVSGLLASRAEPDGGRLSQREDESSLVPSRRTFAAGFSVGL
jgi:hypothetical protein